MEWLDRKITDWYGEKPNYIVVLFQPIGLLFLLAAFVWQTNEEALQSYTEEFHIMQINEKLNYLWMAEYDDAIKTGRVQKQDSAVYYNFVNYDGIRDEFKSWTELNENLNAVAEENDYTRRVRLAFYILGSVFVFLDAFLKALRDRKSTK